MDCLNGMYPLFSTHSSLMKEFDIRSSSNYLPIPYHTFRLSYAQPPPLTTPTDVTSAKHQFFYQSVYHLRTAPMLTAFFALLSFEFLMKLKSSFYRIPNPVVAVLIH
jgi:hypothetical protein